MEPKPSKMVISFENKDYRGSGITIQTAEGRTAYASDEVRSETFDGSQRLVVYAPANFLRPGDYELQLSGVSVEGREEEIANYVLGSSSNK